MVLLPIQGKLPTQINKYAVCKIALFQQIIYESIDKAQLTSSLELITWFLTA